MHYTVELENFQGPLDLLLYLVRKNEIDIQDIPIVTITNQYIEYIDIMKALNLDVAGEFLVMASTLMYLKSRALLPGAEDDDAAEDAETTLDDLKQQLIEYQKFQDAAQRLREQNILEKDVFARRFFPEPADSAGEQPVAEVSIFDLLTAFKKVLERTADTAEGLSVSIEQISVKDTMNEILQRLQGESSGVAFETLFHAGSSRIAVITTFLALLELIKLQAVRIYQNVPFASIYLFPVEVEEAGNHNEI